MANKLVLCFDGTWNTPDDHGHDHDEIDTKETNVVRLYRSIRGTDTVGLADGEPATPPTVTTLKWYDQGVGTHWYDHIRGGAFGFGISRNIRQGYKWLVDNYEVGDEIYAFGFSRGAYSARSLVGFIRNCGLVRRDHVHEADADDNPCIMDAYQLYRTRDGSADTDFARSFRARFCHSDVRIKVLGVWDTVGALGIPLRVARLWNADHYYFHDTRLSGIVDNAFHAIAVDEHRLDYAPSLWEHRPRRGQVVKQEWFVGAHGDVGGGYKHQPLALIPLEWMQGQVQLRGGGLELEPSRIPDVGALSLADLEITDTYRSFGLGLYKLFRDRAFRAVKPGPMQMVHPSVRAKVLHDPRYRPLNPGLIDDRP